MSLQIGIAIPCFKGHITHLKRLFDSIEAQTRKPDMVIVSCSSSKYEDIPYKQQDYTFPFKIITIEEKKSCAQNRNIAGKIINTDIICFFDADDAMHPKRLEFIEQIFIENPLTKLVLHATEQTVNNPYETYDSLTYDVGKLRRCPWGSVISTTVFSNFKSHNGHCTVSKECFKDIQFREGFDYYGRDDTIFCTDIIAKYQNEIVYCPYKLSKYYISHTSENLDDFLKR
jgi:glycosyltransferase involved in cell wall biosynthesis